MFLMVWCSFWTMAQDDYISLQIEPQTIEVGQQFTIVLRTNAEGNLDFELPDEFVQSGPAHSGMSSSINYINNKAQVEKYSYQKITGYIDHPGKYKIGPAKLNTRSGALKSESVTINVIKPVNMISEDPARNLSEPVFGIIQQSAKEIYEGQPLLLEAKVYSQVDVLQIDRFQNMTYQGPHDAHLLHTSKEVDKTFEEIQGRRVMTFKAGKTVIFPERTGTYEISPFQMTLYCSDAMSLFPSRVNIKSNESKVVVKPLPGQAPKEFIGGVGEFSVSSKLSEKHIKQGEVVEYHVTIQGVGNIHNIEVPQLILPKGVVLYGDPTATDDFQFSPRGAEGAKHIVYYLQVNKADSFEIPELKIAYFSPEKNKYVTKTAAPLMLNVTPDESITLPAELDVSDEVAEEQRRFKDPMLVRHSRKGYSGNILVLGGALALPSLLALFFGLFVKYRSEHQEELQKKAMHKTAALRAKESIRGLRTHADADFHTALAQVIYSYLAEKWHVSPSEVTRDVIQTEIQTTINAQRLLALLDELDFARFGGQINHAEQDELAERTQQLIDELEHYFKES